MKWGRYMETTTKAGIVDAMNDTPADDDFDEDRGDYKVFSGIPAAPSAAPTRPAAPAPADGGRQDALDTLKEKGWNN